MNKLIGFLIGITPFTILIIILNIINSNQVIFKNTLIICMIITGIINSIIFDYKLKKME